ncbi:MAG TPA: succinate dehydrogenase [Candidatus Limnocylindria bacterium]|jgi:succinate dehydrogenase / fumarate reductase membrane anchor subunit|nr:succinate dehydrogenase [Candidatus Limnocylindria bacterium]
MSRARTIYAANPALRARPSPEASGFERFMWVFMRISGVILVFMALGHMFIMHILVELTGQEVNFAFVSSRWGNPFWRIYDLVLLVLALVHGVNGARVVIGDYVRSRTARTMLVGLLGVVTVIWLAAGILVIVAFNPDAAPAVGPFS